MKHFLKRLMLTSCFAFTTMTMAANVAKIGNTEYATIGAAITAAGANDVVELIADVNVSGYFVYNKNYTIDGNGHTIKCLSPNTNYPLYFVNVSGYSQTFKNVTIDANSQVPYAMQCINSGSKLTLDNVTIMGGKTMKVKGKNDSYSKTRFGYGIHVNKGAVEAKDVKISNCTVLPAYLEGSSSSFALSGDDCDVDLIATSSLSETVSSTAAGYGAYEVEAKYKILFTFTKELRVISSMPWNEVISQVESYADITVTSATVKLLSDVALADTFTSNNTKLTVEGNKRTVTGTIKFTSSPSTVKNIVLGDGSTLDCTGSTPTGFTDVSVVPGATIVVLGEKTSEIVSLLNALDAETVVFKNNNTVCTNNGASTITLPASTTDYSTKAKAQLAKAAAEMGITTITAVEKPSAIDIEGLELFENVLSFNRTATTRSSSEETATAVVDYAFGITSIGLNAEEQVTVTAKVSKLDKTEGPTFAEGVTVKLYQVVTTTNAETTTTSLVEIPSTATKVDDSTITVTSEDPILGGLGNAPSLTKPLTIKAVK